MSPIVGPVLGPLGCALRARLLTLLLTLMPTAAASGHSGDEGHSHDAPAAKSTQSPRVATALSNRGLVWLAANEPLWALLDSDAAIGLSPEPGFYFSRGIAHGQLGAWQRAIDDYTEAIRPKPDFAFAYNNRGVELEQQGSRAEATADFEHAIKIDPYLAPSRQALQRLYPPSSTHPSDSAAPPSSRADVRPRSESTLHSTRN